MVVGIAVSLMLAAGSPVPPGDVQATVEKIKAERSVRIERPPSVQAAAVVDDAAVTTVVKRRGGGTVKVITARQDLTGYRELASTVRSRKYRTAECTQTFRFSRDGDAKRMPNLLVCWRTSESKSVYTVAVDPDGRPSRVFSVTALESAWKKLR